MPVMCIVFDSCKFFGIEKYEPEQLPELHFRNRLNESVYILPWNLRDGEVFGPNCFYNQLPAMTKVERKGVIKIDDITYRGCLANGMSIHILVFKQSTLDKYSEEEIIRDNIYDARYVLTEDDLVDNKFSIIYTGEDDTGVAKLHNNH